jgi:hypothetical protein
MGFRPLLLTVRRCGTNGSSMVPGPCRGRDPCGSQASGRYAQLVSEIAKFVYKDKAVEEIDFYLGISQKRIHINRAQLAEVGTRLEVGWYTVKVVPKVQKGPPAEYIRNGKKKGTFVFRFRLTFSEEEIEEMPQLRGSVFRDEALICGAIVHEFVHAMLHWEGRDIVRLSDEAAGYLAEALYHVHRETYGTWLDYATSKEARGIYETAGELITKHGLKDSKGKHLNWLEYRALRKAIHAHEKYRHLGPIERWDD